MEIVTDIEALHEKARFLSLEEILSDEMQKFAEELMQFSIKGKYGVGLSAIQVGKPIAITVITSKPTPNRPDLKVFNKTCFNLKILEGFGEKKPMWEGCCSVRGDDGMPIYAKIPRYESVRVSYRDEKGVLRKEVVGGFIGEVMQHEADHNVGRLISDLVDRREFISCDEFHEIMKNRK